MPSVLGRQHPGRSLHFERTGVCGHHRDVRDRCLPAATHRQDRRPYRRALGDDRGVDGLCSGAGRALDEPGAVQLSRLLGSPRRRLEPRSQHSVEHRYGAGRGTRRAAGDRHADHHRRFRFVDLLANHRPSRRSARLAPDAADLRRHPSAGLRAGAFPGAAAPAAGTSSPALPARPPRRAVSRRPNSRAPTCCCRSASPSEPSFSPACRST